MNKIKVKQCYYDPRYPKEKRKLDVVQPIHSGSGDTIVDLCRPNGQGAEEYKQVILTKSQYLLFIGKFGSLKMKNFAGEYGSISFHMPAWDAEYEVIWNNKNTVKTASDINAIDAFTFTEIRKEDRIEEAKDVKPERKKGKEENLEELL